VLEALLHRVRHVDQLGGLPLRFFRPTVILCGGRRAALP